jgi:cyclophilin family peptidyl-prolyl cis-trans isomerase
MTKAIIKYQLICLLGIISMSSCAVLSNGPKGKDELITIGTPQGEIKLVLFEETPRHKENFLKLAREGYYDGTTFHRIIDGFMIQGGDPNTKDDDPSNDGSGNPGYTIPAEIMTEHKHVFGSVAAARLGDNINPEKASSGSQFYIVENKNGTPMLDDAYTVFGQVVDGFNVVEKIAEQPKGARDRPLTKIPMQVKVETVRKSKLAKKYNYNYETKSLEK